MRVRTPESMNSVFLVIRTVSYSNTHRVRRFKTFNFVFIILSPTDVIQLKMSFTTFSNNIDNNDQFV